MGEGTGETDDYVGPGWGFPLSNFAATAGLIGLYIYTPVYSRSIGAEPTLVALIQSANAGMSVIAAYLFGKLADRHRRKPFVLSGMFLTALIVVFGAWVKDPLVLMGLLALAGVTMGLYLGPLVALSSGQRKTGAPRLGRFMGLGAAGFGAAALTTAALTDAFGPHYVFFSSSGFYLLGTIGALALREKKNGGQRRRIPGSLIFRNRAVLTAVLTRHTGATTLWVFWIHYLLDIGMSLWLTGIVGVLNAAVQVLMGFLVSDRFDPTRALIYSLVLTSITFIGFFLSTEPWHIFVLMIPLGACFSLLQVGSFRRIIHDNPDQPSAASGALTGAYRVGSVTGPLMAAVVVQISIGAVILSGAVAALLGLALLLLLDRKSGPLDHEEE